MLVPPGLQAWTDYSGRTGRALAVSTPRVAVLERGEASVLMDNAEAVVTRRYPAKLANASLRE